MLKNIARKLDRERSAVGYDKAVTNCVNVKIITLEWFKESVSGEW